MFEYREFPGGPVAKTPCFHCWGPGFDPTSHAVQKKKFEYKDQSTATIILDKVLIVIEKN